MRIYLRAFEMDDYRLISSWRHDSGMSELVCGNRLFISSEREKKWIESKLFDDTRDIYCAICMKENDAMIGYISIINIDLRNRKAEWGGVTIGDKSMWGQGYASEAAKLILQYVFFEMPINKLQGRVLEDHQVTIKMLNSLGFTRDGVFRDEVFKNGEFHDIYLYSILRSEYLASDINKLQ